MFKTAYACVFLMAASGCLASSPPSNPPVSRGSDATWTTEAWTGTDAPYIQMASDIRRAKQEGQDLPRLAERYRAAARKKPADPAAAFRWGYALYLTYLHDPVRLRKGEIDEALGFLKGVVPPRSYEFARLRFLLESISDEPGAHLKAVGKRLLDRRRDDYEVMYLLVRVLSPGLYPEDRKLASGYCDKLIEAMPDKPQVYYLKGITYQRIYIRSKEADTRQKSIDAFEKYLEIAPDRDINRHMAKRWIGFLRSNATNP